MKQRLMLAQAIMEQPELLVLDEPTNALDKDGIRLFKRIILDENCLLYTSYDETDESAQL